MADSNDQFELAVQQVETLVHSSGCLRKSISLETKDSLLKSLCHFIAIGRATMAIEQYVCNNCSYN